VALVAVVLAFTTVASPWFAWACQALGFQFAFGRVYDRVFEVLLVIALVALWRRLDLGDARAIGLRARGWARELGRGVAIGAGGIAVALFVCWLHGALVPSLRYPVEKTVRKVALGLTGAVIVGVGEEALFRGLLLRRMSLDFGRGPAVAGVTTLYAVVHVLRAEKKPGPVDAWSGWERTKALFAPVVDPGHRPQILGLALFGLLLVAARLRTGGLWVAIGLHASWVAVFRVGRLFFDMRPRPAWLVGSGWPPLVGGAAGWIAVAVSALLLFAVYRSAGRSAGRS
jgi:membrane protease YdiL (CAAX protease family)